MTVIVWDGKTLAADKQATHGDLKRKATKIRRIRGHLVGISGDWDRGQELLQWYEQGADPSKYPEFQKTQDDYVGMLVITPDKRILKYERSHVPIDFSEEEYYCMGSGRDFATAGVYLGLSAAAAVHLTINFCASCGLGVDTLTLEGDDAV